MTSIRCRIYRAALVVAMEFVVIVGLMGAASAQGATIYVSTAGNDAGDGLTWATAKLTVQAGLDTAAAGDQVWVAAGAYVEAITLKAEVALYGGFAGGETDLSQRNWTSNITILDGNRAYCVVRASPHSTRATRIDGFTVSNCYWNGSSGAILCTSIDCSMTITNCTVKGNEGTGIYCAYNASPAILNNTISGNTSLGVYCEDSQALIANNLISGNGGGIGCHNSSANVIINNTIIGNVGADSYGIICSGSETIANTIVAFHTIGIAASTGTSVRNCCVYGNTTTNYGGVPDQTGTNGNISADPKLSWPFYSNAHIQPGSSCIDAGDDGVVQGDWLDIDGQPRILGTHVDIGADESNGTTWPPPPNEIVRVSLSGDDANDGSSWALAKRTVQAAIDTVAGSRGEVWVKEGTYLERITLGSNAHVYGGFAGTEMDRASRDWERSVTVLDGSQGGSVVRANGILASLSTIDGFTHPERRRHLTEAASGATPRLRQSPTTRSRAILLPAVVVASTVPVRPTVRNNRIVGNSAPTKFVTSGGGIYCGAGIPVIVRNVGCG